MNGMVSLPSQQIYALKHMKLKKKQQQQQKKKNTEKRFQIVSNEM